MNLRLDRPVPAAELGGAIDGLIGTVGDRAARRRNAEIGQELLGLIFVNVQLRLLLIAGRSARARPV
jgi:hypothetical protein